MRRNLYLTLGILAVFVLTVGIMWRLMPYPRKEVDYLVIGGSATMVSMAVLFIVLINTSYKGNDIFFRRRKP